MRASHMGAYAASLPPQTPLHQLLHLFRHIRSNPHDVIPPHRPYLFKPFAALPIAAPQQRAQLRGFVFEEGSCGVACRGGSSWGDCPAKFGRGTPGHNSSSHWCALFPKLVHVIGQTVRVLTHPGRRLLIPRIRVNAQAHRQPAARQSGSLIHSVIRQSGEAHSFHVFVAHMAGRLVAGAFTVENRSRVGKKNSSRNSRIEALSAAARRRDTKH